MFVVVVTGGLGSIKGALVASIIIGLMQTLAVALEVDFNSFLNLLGFEVDKDTTLNYFTSLTISQLSPIVPYLLLILVLIARPRGLFGKRDV